MQLAINVKFLKWYIIYFAYFDNKHPTLFVAPQSILASYRPAFSFSLLSFDGVFSTMHITTVIYNQIFMQKYL